ncbi:MAG: TlpA disulfide reductase family protein [Gemmatimonadota bacterium]|nr:TlpA disulfide reductase family protein [Gemmatimonadota bacterium]
MSRLFKLSVNLLFLLSVVAGFTGDAVAQNSQPAGLSTDEQKIVNYVMDEFAKSKAGKPNFSPRMAGEIQQKLGITITPQMVPSIQRAVVTELKKIEMTYNKLDKGSKAPAFDLPAMAGGNVKLSDLKGKVVVVNFWATWCPPCLQEMPGLNEVYNAYKDKGVEVLGLTLDEEGLPATKPTLTKLGIDYPILEADKATYQAYGHILTIPFTYVIDRNGVIQKKFINRQDKEAFEAALDEVL